MSIYIYIMENPNHKYFIELSKGQETLPDGEEEKDLAVYFTKKLKL